MGTHYIEFSELNLIVRIILVSIVVLLSFIPLSITLAILTFMLTMTSDYGFRVLLIGLFIILQSILPLITIKRYREAGASKTWPSVEGKITQTEKTYWYDDVRVYYSYNVYGMDYQSQTVKLGGFGSQPGTPNHLESWMNTNQYSIGNRVNVYYNPDKPRRACLEPGAHYGLGELIFGLYLIFSFFGVLVSFGFGVIAVLLYTIIFPIFTSFLAA